MNEHMNEQMSDLTTLLGAALAATVAGGREVMAVYRREYTVTEKEDRSPLTEADTRSHHAIMAHLSAATPEIPVLSEEGAQLPHAERTRWERFWLVDPLDGTKEFIKHNDEFTVNVALVERGVPVLGVVYTPALGRLYLGVQGIGAWWVPQDPEDSAPEMDGQGEVTGATALPDAALQALRPYTVVASRSHMSPETAAFVEQRRREYPDLELTSAGSSLKICRVAEGSADEYPRFAPTMEWDTAAGDAVARAAGCEVVRWDAAAGAPDGTLQYNKQDLHNPWFLVRRRPLDSTGNPHVKPQTKD